MAALPKDVRRDWEETTAGSTKVPDVDKLITFLRMKAQSMDNPAKYTMQEGKSDSRPQVKKERHQRQKAAINASTAPVTQPPQPQPSRPISQPTPPPANSNYQNFIYERLLCSDKHPLFLCSRFNTMTVEHRQTHLRSNHLCFNCLAPGHKTADCRSYGHCRTCRDKHHTLVHQDKPPSPPPVAVIHAAASTGPPTIQASLTMTSKVLLTGPTGQTLVARALLDSGSTISLITARPANTLKLPRTSTHITFSGVQDSVASPSHSLVNVCLSPLQESEQQHQIVAAVVSTVTCDLPLQGAEGVRDLPHLKGLKLADPTF